MSINIGSSAFVNKLLLCEVSSTCLDLQNDRPVPPKTISIDVFLAIALIQSLATRRVCRPKSRANAMPSRQATTSATSASTQPSNTSAEAPRKLPSRFPRIFGYCWFSIKIRTRAAHYKNRPKCIQRFFLFYIFKK